ncbi:MAG: AMP-binding protein [Hyphomicrobiaceae bacterium]|nr:MAG: AMP-binding protein [Hyphomicrobiaceae bacterium]
MNLIDFFDKAVARQPDRPVMIFENQPWSYRSVDVFATRIAHGLREMGIGRESKCAVLSRNHPLAFVALLGILKAHGAWVPLNPGDGTDHALYLCEFFDVEVVFFQAEHVETVDLIRAKVRGVRHLICLDADLPGCHSLEAWASRYEATPIFLPWDPDAVCMVRGTGGTTGRPKGVMNTNRNFEVTIANYLASLRFDGPPVYLAAPPLTHAPAIFAFVTIALAGTIVIHRKFDAKATLEAIEQHRVSLLYLPPTAMYGLLSHPDVRNHDYSSLRHFVYGAAPTAASKLREAIDVFGPVMTQAYGQTEVPTSVTLMPPAALYAADGSLHEQRLLSCGQPTPFTRVALMDDDGSIVPPGKIGEIVVQGGLVMKGYYKNPEATAEASKYGWHHTGDLAYQDEEGFIYICDRKKEMIITGGFNVYPLEVEQVILSHPAVQDCAVVGVPDEKWGEAIKAVIELKHGCSVSGAEIIATCKGKLGSVKAPKSVDFIDVLPRSPVGKVMRKEVRKKYWEGQSRQI